MPTETLTARQVKNANRLLYDAAALDYESIDGRRSPALERWLRARLQRLRQNTTGDVLLDIGAGSGLVCRCAKDLFPVRIGIDLSHRILAAHRNAFTLALAADTDHLPFADCSIDAAVCFAALHHLYDFDRLTAELARILKPGAIFYADHDMNHRFYRRFRLPLNLYRRIRRADKHYLQTSHITPELYRSAEFHETGIDADRLESLLRQHGFRVETQHHWFGLSPLTNRLFGQKPYKPGWAPLTSIYAIKQ